MVNGYQNSLCCFENLSHPIKALPKEQGISGQGLPVPEKMFQATALKKSQGLFLKNSIT